MPAHTSVIFHPNYSRSAVSITSPSLPERPPRTRLPPRPLRERPYLHPWAPAADPIPPRPSRPNRRLARTFAVLCLVNFLCAIDGSILSVALPTIARDLRGSALEVFWAGTSFLLASAVLQPLWAELSDILGQKRTLLAALLFFTVGSVLAVIGTSFALLLAGRVVQGVGVGGLVALTYVIVTRLVSLQERGKWFGLISLQWAVGSTLGPLVGGALTQNAGWRWIFGINFPFCGLAFVAAHYFLRLDEGTPRSAGRRLLRLDWLGVLLFVSALTLLLVPLTWGGVMYDWGAAATLAPLGLGLGLLVCFVLYSVCVSRRPFLRASIFATATGRAAYLSALVHGMVVFCVIFYMPLYFQAVKGYSTVVSGVALLPFSLTTGSLAIATGLLISKSGTYRLHMLIGWGMITLGMGFLRVLGDDTSVPIWVLVSGLGGVGFGMVWSAGSFAAQAPTSAADSPFAASTFVFVRALGQTFGVAVGGTIFQNTFKEKLKANPLYAPFATQWAQDAPALVEVIPTLADRDVKDLLVSVYAASLQSVWLVMCVLSGIVMLSSFLWIRDCRFRRASDIDLRDLPVERQASESVKTWV